MKHSSEKKNYPFFFFHFKWKNNKTTNWSHGGKNTDETENILLLPSSPLQCHLTMEVILLGQAEDQILYL